MGNTVGVRVPPRARVLSSVGRGKIARWQRPSKLRFQPTRRGRLLGPGRQVRLASHARPGVPHDLGDVLHGERRHRQRGMRTAQPMGRHPLHACELAQARHVVAEPALRVVRGEPDNAGATAAEPTSTRDYVGNEQ